MVWMIKLSFLFTKLLLIIFYGKLLAQVHHSAKLSSSTTSSSTTLPTLSICACMKDEHMDILEWVEYHISKGVSKFYLADNNSSSPTTFDILFPFIQRGVVEYFYVTNPKLPNAQLYIYTYCINNYAKYHTFMAIIDVDEFIVVNGSKSIPEILQNFTQYGGLTLNWMFFGSSGHVSRPKGGSMANYWKCIENFHVKSIVNTKYVTTIDIGIHHFNYSNGMYAVDTNGHEVRSPFNPGFGLTPDPSLFKVMYINHYVVRSLEDFQRKSRRGSGAGNHKTDAFFYHINNQTVKNCPILKSNYF